MCSFILCSFTSVVLLVVAGAVVDGGAGVVSLAMEQSVPL